MPVKIILMPDPAAPTMHAGGLKDEYDRVQAAAAGAGYIPLRGDRTLAGAMTTVARIVAARHDCLSVLEIDAHGNPWLCDGIPWRQAAAFGDLLKKVTLCDQVNIYLAGCNTGVRTENEESLAQEISRHTPTEAKDHVRVTVFGSVGYLTGTHMEGNTVTSRDCTVDGHYYPRYPDVGIGASQSPGSLAVSGIQAPWRGFREGRKVT
jgi:hypothetical protein